MVALGPEPRSAGIFRLACTWQMHAFGLRRVGSPGGQQYHQITHSSSFPGNWRPRYYQVILYPQGSKLTRVPTLMMVSVECCADEMLETVCL